MVRGNPKFNTKAERVRYAIRKKYLSEEEWTNEEIAEELNVKPEVVSRYLNQTPQAEELQRAKSKIETEQWKQLLTDLMQRIDRLSELERQLWNVVEPVITAYELVDAEAEIDEYHLQQGGDSLRLDFAPEEDDEGIRRDMEIPIPSEWDEMPQFSRLRSVWDERRRTEEQLADLLGLDAAEEISLSGDVIEQKVYKVENDNYPDATPHKQGEDPKDEETKEDEDD